MAETFGLSANALSLKTFFFFAIGLEIMREMTSGELRDRRRRALPDVAAIDGAHVPAVIYAAFQWRASGQRGWPIPMATGIALASARLTIRFS